jgi:hypothetical protein
VEGLFFFGGEDTEPGVEAVPAGVAGGVGSARCGLRAARPGAVAAGGLALGWGDRGLKKERGPGGGRCRHECGVLQNIVAGEEADFRDRLRGASADLNERDVDIGRKIIWGRA